MIYFDSGATTLQKPPAVARAVLRAMERCASPGRGGHRPSFRAAETVYKCRQAVCALYNFDSPERIVFTLNATHALNLAIKSLLRGGGHAVISGYEHNSVVRPLEAMENVTYTAAHSPLFDAEKAVSAIESAIGRETRAVILNHVSNVFGYILPLERVDELCARRNLPLIIDASQSAGTVAIDLSRLKSAAFVCFPGHKGLYGPQGTGVLICCKDDHLYSLIEGGTGSNSLDARQPDFLPDVFESGTHNVPGIAGLLAGINFVRKSGAQEILSHERELVRRANEGLCAIPKVKSYFGKNQAGTLAFTSTKAPPEVIAERLAERGICVRAGLHCAPLAHKSARTLPAGAVRLSFSAMNTLLELDSFVSEINDILKKF